MWNVMVTFNITCILGWNLAANCPPADMCSQAALTLKENSILTKKGKLIALRIFFSFNVCSTCFNFTTCKAPAPALE